jgi:hypothetical protein
MPHPASRATRRASALLLAATSALAPAAASAEAPALLFHLSADRGTTADVAAPGTERPNFEANITTVADGAAGPALRCADLQRLSWWAPGNIHAQRGTLSFFWRSREPVGPTEFPVFRVGYADHSSWDMVWLRLDYNGHGFDAFVTDNGLARTRVSATLAPFPAPEAWTHLTFAWDETVGVRLYVNGALAAEKLLPPGAPPLDLDTGLDQFGPHSRIISPYQVQSDYNFTRGGDIDEIRIHDRMLDAASIAALAAGRIEPLTAAPTGDVRAAWLHRHGWDDPASPPPPLPGATTLVRKVQILDAIDERRWWWKGNDGIRETTWPGVYNQSRLPGRNDYFQLPDWDCYSTSGKSVTFHLPDEPWNHIEIVGPAWGALDSMTGPECGSPAQHIAQKPHGTVHAAYRLAEHRGPSLVQFTNAEQETPIQEFEVLHVASGAEPAGRSILTFRFAATVGDAVRAVTAGVEAFIAGRHNPAERSTLFAVETGALGVAPTKRKAPDALPLVHVIVPDVWDNRDDGLDGLALDLPALHVPSRPDGLIPLAVRIKDPLWPARDMLEFTFSVPAGKAQTIYFDVRDRILPPGQPLYLTMASAAPDFGPASLADAELRLVFKPRSATVAEHAADRFTQVRDAYAMIVEEHAEDPVRYRLRGRLEADLRDLLRAAPDHELGRQYAALVLGAPRPPFTPGEPPAGVPAWAFRQVELLRRIATVVDWYIDQRQLNGELGGGLSDDTDLANAWPGLALMGHEPDKLRDSLRQLLDACYAHGMFTNGLSTIQTDELHSYEEGINTIGQLLILGDGSPRQLERAMETTRALGWLTGVNAAGHRHIRSSYFSGAKMATEGPWGWSKSYSYLLTQPAFLLGDYNANPLARQYVRELADGLLAHRRADPAGKYSLPSAIHFETDAEGHATRAHVPWPIFWASWRWSGDRRYLDPILDAGYGRVLSLTANTLDRLDLRETEGARVLAETPARIERDLAHRTTSFTDLHTCWQMSGDKTWLERLYAMQIEAAALREYVNTEGSIWTDRVIIQSGEIQRARLGGVALLRNETSPGHVVSWRFEAPATATDVAILIPDATPTTFTIIAYNLDTRPVRTAMTGWDIEPGHWEIIQGIDTDGDDRADRDLATRTERFERSRAIDVTLPPRTTSVLKLRRVAPGLPYAQRCDLGIDREDVSVAGGVLTVHVHSLGAVASPAATLLVRASDGSTIASAPIPPLQAPLELQPVTTDVVLTPPGGMLPEGAVIEIDPREELTELTRLNNTVVW